MNTVDALKDFYKTLCGKDYAGDPNPTDAEMISAIAKDASAGGSGGSDSDLEINMVYDPDADTTEIAPLPANLPYGVFVGMRVNTWDKYSPELPTSSEMIARVKPGPLAYDLDFCISSGDFLTYTISSGEVVIGH